MIPIPRVLRFMRTTPWAILPEKLEEIVALVEEHAGGERLTAEEVTARIGVPNKPEPRVSGSTAVVPIYGVIAQRVNVMSAISGGTSTQLIGESIAAYVADKSVSAVVLDIDSPGGSVFGVTELASRIMAMRGQKPIVASVNSLAASAAYWIASAADEIVITPGGLAGSIGVVGVHVDSSKSEEMRGHKTSLVSAGKYKTEGSDLEPLSETAREAMQARVDSYYDRFVADVARGRGVAETKVRNGYGEGRVVTSGDALRAGMVDRIATIEQVIARLQRQSVSRSVSASIQSAELLAEKPAARARKVQTLEQRQSQYRAISQ